MVLIAEPPTGTRLPWVVVPAGIPSGPGFRRSLPEWLAVAGVTTMYIAAILLSLAAVGGLALASFPLRGIPRPPTWMALGHGAVAAAGLLTLIYFALTTAVSGFVLAATAILVAAALGGIAIFAAFHLRERPLPIVLVLGHGLTALTGLVLLWLSILQVI